MRSFRPATALAFTLLLSAGFSHSGCSEPPYIGGECELDADCQSEYQNVPGTGCNNGKCECLDPLEHVCCARGDTSADCFLSCRQCSECSVGTQGCPVGCQSDAECQGPPDPRCGQGRCVQGACTIEVHPGALASQKYGDCAAVYCEPSGDAASLDDPSDIYDDGLACTQDTCINGDALNTDYPPGSPYPIPGESGVCYEGERFDCIVGSPSGCAAGLACLPAVGQSEGGGYCAPWQCTNLTQDAGEPAIDCGGVCIRPCPNNSSCQDDLDCVSKVCAGTPKRCLPATCEDGQRNDSESGVDCGGSSGCGPCLEGQRCLTPGDCASQVCMAGKCQAPTCIDGVRNGGEAGIDCGGPCGSPCP